MSITRRLHEHSTRPWGPLGVAEEQGVVLLVGVEGERLGEMGVGLRRLAQITQGDAQIPVGPNEERGVVLMLGQGKTFLIQRSGGLNSP